MILTSWPVPEAGEIGVVVREFDALANMTVNSKYEVFCFERYLEEYRKSHRYVGCTRSEMRNWGFETR
jgi:hypothetical protein